jgi:hypothetical protein
MHIVLRVKSLYSHEGETMKRPLIIIFSVIAVLLVISITMTSMLGPKTGNTFSTISRDLNGYGGGGAPAEAPAAEPAFDSFAAEESARSSVSNADQQQQAQDRLVIRNADLAIVVKDPRQRMQEISDLATEFGGFVVSSSLYQSYPAGKEVPEATIVIRVPAARLDEALRRIKEGAVEVDYENISGQDVTSQYVDLQSQLKAKQAAEKKLLEIMEQATRAEDVLAIYLQVQNVQTEIEILKGQIKYLEESADLSAISVRLIAEEGTQPIEIGPWKPEGAAKEAIQDLIFFFQNFVDFLIRFILLTLPALILIAIPLFIVYLGGRAVYRRIRRSRAQAEETEEVKG